MDKLAAALGLDPVELRLLNALAPGDTLPTGQKVDGSLPVAEVIRRAAALEPPEPEELSLPLPAPFGRGSEVLPAVGAAIACAAVTRAATRISSRASGAA
jgi:hypothetical protein